MSAPPPFATSTPPASALRFQDPRSLALQAQAERAARSDASVLILGDAGSGKRALARHIHTLSGRGAFVVVLCGAFDRANLEAALFGAELGGGGLAAAQGGTLLLDDVGALPLALQGRLLQALQARPAPDVRLIATSPVDLRGAVQAQRVRAELVAALSGATLTLAPLRQRPGDILPLAQHFLCGHARRLQIDDVALSAEAEAALQRHAWPGHVRELDHVIRGALLVCRFGVVRVADLHLEGAGAANVTPDTPTAADTATAATAATTAPPPDAWQHLHDAAARLLDQGRPHLWRQVEQLLVQLAHARADANQVHAARLLGTSRHTLRTLLKRHGLLADASTSPRPAPPRPLARSLSRPAYPGQLTLPESRP